MRSSRLHFPCLLLLLFACLLLIGCGNRLPRFVTDEGSTIRRVDTDERYAPLSASFEPIAEGAEYGNLDLGKVTLALHEIKGLSPQAFLATSYGDVYAGVGEAVPTPAEGDATLSALHVCTNTALVVSELSLPTEHISQEQSAQLMLDILDTYRTAAAVRYPSYAEVARSYILRLESEDWPGLYYSILLIEYAEDITGTIEHTEISLGRTFLYDRAADRCVPVSDMLFRLLDGESVTE